MIVRNVMMTAAAAAALSLGVAAPAAAQKHGGGAAHVSGGGGGAHMSGGPARGMAGSHGMARTGGSMNQAFAGRTFETHGDRNGAWAGQREFRGEQREFRGNRRVAFHDRDFDRRRHVRGFFPFAFGADYDWGPGYAYSSDYPDYDVSYDDGYAPANYGYAAQTYAPANYGYAAETYVAAPYAAAPTCTCANGWNTTWRTGW